ncbi:hypothetical protein AF332_11500 [Sporosarcina globispora]|uniref:Uncharacterized protein n=1 Tax=Sporosarcina globispora TaxID=1459 RepID=A0A0M0GC09_SPOGL|nr:hypothetical protein [Sporosarcina globispora]KON87389.1 hypothetical protein AF332_11500 [Sporosarcina globispora]
MNKFTWKNVIHGEHALRFGHIDNFFNQIVVPSGYPYFIWNDIIYRVEDRYSKNRFTDTGCTINDIEG